MVDPWEAMQKGYQRTLTVLSRIRNSLCKDGLADQSIYSEDCLLQHSTSSPHFFHNYNQCVVRKNFLSGSLKVMLLCGSDLLESFSTLGVWIPEQVRTICRDFGVICIHREGKDIGNLIAGSDILQEYKDNIIPVDEIVPNQISSSRVRDCIRRCLSIKYLTCDEVIEYITEHKLFMEAEGSHTRL